MSKFKKSKQTKQVNVMVTPSLASEFFAACEKKEVTASEILRKAMRDFIDDKKFGISNEDAKKVAKAVLQFQKK